MSDFSNLLGQTPKHNETKMTTSVKLWSPELYTRPKRSARPPRIFSQMLGLKNLEINGEIKIFSGIFPNFRVDLAQNPLNPRTNGWAPFDRFRPDLVAGIRCRGHTTDFVLIFQIFFMKNCVFL